MFSAQFILTLSDAKFPEKEQHVVSSDLCGDNQFRKMVSKYVYTPILGH